MRLVWALVVWAAVFAVLTRFSAVWRDTLSVLVARGRAQVSVAAAVADWPKRIRDMRYVDHEDYGETD